MKSNLKNEFSGELLYETLLELKKDISLLNEKVEEVSSRLDELTSMIRPEEETEIGNHLQETVKAINLLDKKNKGIPISRNDLAQALNLHPNTAYVRAENLVKKGRILKYFGRELGKDRFEEKKAVFYSPVRSLYNPKFINQLESDDKVAYSISLTLLQDQPISEQELLGTGKLTESVLKEGLVFLLSRGLIIQETTADIIYYRIRTISSEKNEEL